MADVNNTIYNQICLETKLDQGQRNGQQKIKEKMDIIKGAALRELGKLGGKGNCSTQDTLNADMVAMFRKGRSERTIKTQGNNNRDRPNRRNFDDCSDAEEIKRNNLEIDRRFDEYEENALKGGDYQEKFSNLGFSHKLTSIHVEEGAFKAGDRAA